MKNNQAAIDNLEAMLDPSLGVDAVLIGPHDLSCNLGTTYTTYNSPIWFNLTSSWQVSLFIGPESDHWECLSVTN